ncbi:MAG: DUF6502 family protein, partial [Steroidobacteraceae bacterium]
IFSPLARILQRAGVPYYEFRDILKAAYIDAAIRDGIPGYPEKPSSAALACLVGVPQADIEHLVRNPDVLKPPRETNTALIAAMLTRWSTDSAFQGPYGLPQQLAFDTPIGRSFSDLVKTIRSDANAAEIWDEMIFGGTVERVGAKHVKMSGRQLVLGANMAGNFYEALGRAMEDLAATINHNQGSSAASKRFQRSVYGDRPLPVSKLEEFSELTKKVMKEAMVEIDDWLNENTLSDSPGDAIDVGVTVFEYHREAVENVPLSDLVTAGPRTEVPAWVQMSGLNAPKP